MATTAEIRAADILNELHRSGQLPLTPNWRRDHVLMAAVRLLARRGLVVSSFREGRPVLLKREGASASPDPETRDMKE